MRNICCIVMLLSLSASAIAQSVKFELKAPSVVSVGEIFTVEYTVNQKYQDNSFVPPKFEGFNVIAGPSIMLAQETSIDGKGNVVRNTVYGISYALQAASAGMFEIAAAKITVDGKPYTTKPLPVEAVAADAARSQGDQTTIGDDDIFLRLQVSKNNVYKGEPVRATFKLYRRPQMQLSGYDNRKVPAFNGFWVQALNLDNQQSWQRETYNNKVYETAILHDVMLYPLQSGTINIDPMSLDIIANIVVQASTGNSFFDSFIGGQAYQEVRKHISSSTAAINVRELPGGASPIFNGAVGSFQITGGLNNSNLAANGAGTYTIRISGNGNLPQISAPKIVLPASFEQYPVKSTDGSNNTTPNGISGYREFEYPFIARSEGVYTIEPVKFVYFDPKQQEYIVLTLPAVSVDVHADAGTGSGSAGRGMISGVSREEVKMIGNDIRYIRVDNKHWSKRDSAFFLSVPYILIILSLIAAFIGIYIYFRKYMREISDAALLRNKKARKIALSRLKAAAVCMGNSDERGFYEEMLRAMWGYMSDKLNMPVANLTKDNIREELVKRGVAQEKAEEFIEIISVCEYAQYSPQSGGRMNEIYNRTALLLSKIETVIK